MNILFNCPFCGKDTNSLFQEFSHRNLTGDVFHCTCEHCLNVSEVENTPFEVLNSRYIEGYDICLN